MVPERQEEAKAQKIYITPMPRQTMQRLLFLVLFAPCLLLALVLEEANDKYDPDEWRTNTGYPMDYPDNKFVAIVFITPELNSCAGKAKILYIIQDSLSVYKNGDEFKINNIDFCVFGHYAYKPMYMLGDFKNGKIDSIELLKMDEEILAHKAIYILDRGDHGAGVVSTQFDVLLPECSSKLKLDCSVHRKMLMLHAFHTPYFNPLKASSPEVDTLVREVDNFFSYMGKSEKEKESFFRRLSQNREPIKIKPAQAKFIALGSITGMREFSKGDSSFCDIRIAPHFIFRDGEKREGKLEANIKANGWGLYYRQKQGRFYYEIRGKKKGECFPAIEAFQLNYIFGSFDEKYKDLKLVIDSVASPWDFFYHDGNLVDLRMGLSYDEFLSYFMPKGLTFKDVYLRTIGISFNGELHALTPKQQKEIEAAIKKVCEAKKNGAAVLGACPQGETKQKPLD